VLSHVIADNRGLIEFTLAFPDIRAEYLKNQLQTQFQDFLNDPRKFISYDEVFRKFGTNPDFLLLLEQEEKFIQFDLIEEMQELPQANKKVIKSVRIRMIRDQQLPDLSQFPSLSRMDLTDTGLTDDGIKNLPAQLKVLNVGFRITNAGLADFPKAIEQLRLGNNQRITDEGLEFFKMYKSLKFLDLQLTDVSREGVLRLRR